MAGLTTTTDLTAPVNVVFQRKFLERAKARCVYFAGSKPGEVLPSHSGSFNVRWRRYDNIDPTTSALTELTGAPSYPTRAGTSVAKTDNDATASKYGQVMYLTEEADLLNFNGQTAEIVDIFGIACGRSLNRLQRNVLEDGVTLVYASGASADANVADPINGNLIEYVATELDNNNAVTFMGMTQGSQNYNTSPIYESYVGFCHSYVAADIRKAAGFIAVERYAGQTEVWPGEFGQLGRVRWVSSSEASVDASSGGAPGSGMRSTSGGACDLFTSVVLGMNAHGAMAMDKEMIRRIYRAGDVLPGAILINKTRGSSGVADALDEISSIGWKGWHVGDILNSTWAYGIRTGATKLI